MKTTHIIALLLLMTCTGVAGAQQADCMPADGYRFVCGPTDAEDLVRVPDTDWAIASGMAPGTALFLLDTRALTAGSLYPGTQPRARHDMARYGACPGAPDPVRVTTHGLTIKAGAADHATLYAVGHGGREAIEVFDIDTGPGSPVITWIGCVLMPEGLNANSVAAMNDGTILATVLVHPDKTFFEAISGQPSGGVYKWTPGDDGFALIPGSELPANNGIEVSADGRTLYVAASGLHRIVALSNTNPARQLGMTEDLGITPDNIHMGENGRLITAGMHNVDPVCGSIIDPATFDLATIAKCPRPFRAYAVDPDTLATTLISNGPATPGWSNATMALEVGDDVWLGTFSGNRIAIRPQN
ncbi:MAG: hypothetical protein H6978_15445 [Gammaproteobacteria bacterium]|nr:hypothetical protein [Gammaproteobacteria bacterium]